MKIWNVELQQIGNYLIVMKNLKKCDKRIARALCIVNAPDPLGYVDYSSFPDLLWYSYSVSTLKLTSSRPQTNTLKGDILF